MPDIIQEGHADRLEYGWWEAKRGHVLIPRTLQDKRNYVISHEELAAYDLILMDMRREIEREQDRVALTLKAMRRGYASSWERETPTLTSLAHLLEFLVKLGKQKLAMMEFLCYTTKRFNDERRQGIPEAEAPVVGDQAPQAAGTQDHQPDVPHP